MKKRFKDFLTKFPTPYLAVVLIFGALIGLSVLVYLGFDAKAAIPTVNGEIASSITDAGVTLKSSITDIPDKNITARGFEYGATSSYGTVVNDAVPTNFTYDTKWGSKGTGNSQFEDYSPRHLAINSKDEVFVIDWGNKRIEKFNRQGNFVLSWGSNGTGNGQFQFPQGIAIDEQDSVYIADANGRIQKFNEDGTYMSQWSVDAGALHIAISDDQYIYVSFLTKVKKFTLDGSFILEWGSDQQSTNDGEFSQIIDVVASSDGFIYVADTINDSVQKFDEDGNFIAKWDAQGTGDGQFNGLLGLGADGDGNFYVTDYFHRVQKFDGNGNFILKFGSKDGSPSSDNGIFNVPYHVAFDSGGNAYVADSSNYRVQRFVKPGTFPHGDYSIDISGLSCGTKYYFRAFATNADGTAHSDGGEFTTKKCAGEAPTTVTTVGSSEETQDSAKLIGEISSYSGNSTVTARGIEYGKTTAYGNTAQSSVPSNYSFETEWGSVGTADGQFKNPLVVKRDSQGNVYVLDRQGLAPTNDYSHFRIQKFNSQGNFLLSWRLSGGAIDEDDFINIEDFAIDSQGNIYVSDQQRGKIQKYSNTGELITEWGSMGTGNGQFGIGPSGIAIDSADNVFVADLSNARIQKFSSNGTFLSKFGSPGTGNGQFMYARYIAIDAGDNIYVSDYYLNRIQKFNSAGVYVTKWSHTGVSAIASDSAGNIYATRGSNIQLTKFTSSGSIVNQWGSSGTGPGKIQSSFVTGITTGPNGDVYVTDYLGNKVIKFINPGSYPRGEFTEEASSLECGTTYHYRAFAVDTDGTSYGADKTFVTADCGTPFITTWKTDNPGTSANNQITIPTVGAGYNYTVDWGDGNTSTNQTGDATHTYSAPGIYTIKISGDFPQIRFFGGLGDSQKILTVEQWGDISWRSMEQAFYGASNLIINAIDEPDLTNVTNMAQMFSAASSMNSDIDHWDVSTITDMTGMFSGASSFDKSLNSWDVSNVNSMDSMFLNAVSFNSDISGWDVSSVTNMKNMFRQASSFNQPIGSWSTNNVTDMSEMFVMATAFNQPLNSWNVSNVTNMKWMFSYASSFDQPLNSWNTGNVTNMYGLFSHASSFNQDINSWDVSNVTNMNQLFSDATSFNQPLNSWNVSNVTDMAWMFTGASSFDQPLNSWNTGNVTTMAVMFYQATAFNQPLNSWNVSNVTDMSSMFSVAAAFNQPLNNWNVSNVTNMEYMFWFADAFNQPLNSWNVSNITSMRGLLGGAQAFNQDISSWDTSNVTDMSSMFYASNSFDQSLGSWNVSNVTTMVQMFEGSGLSAEKYDSTLIGWSALTLKSGVTFDAGSSNYCAANNERQSIIDTYNWTINDGGENCPAEQRPFIIKVKTDNPGSGSNKEFSLQAWQEGEYSPNYTVDCDNDGSSEFTGQSTSEVTCTYPESGEYEIALSGEIPHIRFNVGYDSEVPNSGQEQKLLDVIQWGDIQWHSMEAMFSGASNLQISATDAPDLSNVVNMRSMLAGATGFNSNINHWDVSHVTNMYALFNGATSFNEPLNEWDVSNVTDMEGIFRGATSFNSDITSWDTGSVTTLRFAFADAHAFNQPIGGWNVSNVTDMNAAFANAITFNQELNSWHVSKVTNMGHMFASARSFNKPLDSWNTASVTRMDKMFGTTFGGNFRELDNYNSTFNQPLNTWDVSSVTNMAGMFDAAVNFNQPLNNWNVSNVTSMASMFANSPVFNQSLNNWNVASVVTMSGMFAKAAAFNQPLNNWNVSNVSNMTGMFNSAKSFDQSLASWNISNVTNMTYMFGNLNEFVESLMGGLPYDEWPQGYKDMYNLPQSGLSVANYDATLQSWSQQLLKADVIFDAGLSKYCNASSERQAIISNYSWIINDSGEDCQALILNAPQDLSGVPAPASIELSWDQVENAEDYLVQFKQSASADWEQLTSDTPYRVVGGLALATSYDFRVMARNSTLSVESDWSEVLTISTLPQQTYNISDCQQLQSIAINPVTLDYGDATGNYVMTKDIDCSETQSWDWSELFNADSNIIFKGFLPLGLYSGNGPTSIADQAFAGTFDGKGHSINNLYQDIPDIPGDEGGMFIGGMFMAIGGSGSAIKNLTLNNFSSTSFGLVSVALDGSVIDNVHLKNFKNDNNWIFSYGHGGLVNYALSTEIKNSSVEGIMDFNLRPIPQDFLSEVFPDYIGGLIGFAYDTTIEKSFSDLQLTVTNTRDQAIMNVGGIIGNVFEGDEGNPGNNLIANVYTKGNINARVEDTIIASVGGISGSFKGEVRNSYSSNDVTLSANGAGMAIAGGFAGGQTAMESYPVRNSFSVSKVNLSGTAELMKAGFITSVLANVGETNIKSINNYYDATRSGQASCVNEVWDEDSVTNWPNYVKLPDITNLCTAINNNGQQSNYFIDNKTNPPLNSWDFSTIWRTNYNGYPDFVGGTKPDVPNIPIPPNDPPPYPSPNDPRPPVESPQMPEQSANNPPQRFNAIPPSIEDKPVRLSEADRVRGSVIGPLVDLARKIPKPVARAIPYSLLAVLLALSALYAYTAYLESRKRQIHTYLMDRFKQLQLARKAYLALTSHYMSTPIAQMRGTVELMASLKKVKDDLIIAATNQLNGLRRHTSDLLDEAQSLSAGSQTVIQSFNNFTGVSVLTDPRIWLPTVTTITLVTLVNFVFVQADRYDASLINIGSQIIVAIAGVGALAASLYYLKVNKRLAAAAKDQADLEREHGARAVQFVASAYAALSQDLEALKAITIGFASQPESKSLTDALMSLDRMVNKLDQLHQLTNQVEGIKWSIDMSGVMEKVISDANTQATAALVNLNTSVPNNLQLAIEEKALYQLLSSVITNAIQFTSKGGAVNVLATVEGNMAVFKVQDNGVGISAEKLDRIFAPFSRATSTDQFDHGGLGLDLYMDRLIVQQYNGDIKIASQEGKGTEVTILIPLA